MSKRRSRATAQRPLSNRTIALAAVLVLCLAGAVLFVLLQRYAGVGPAIELDAIRTAGTLIVGTGGAIALLLAARRQRSTELTLIHTEADAAERRITELYTKAADQLGSDHAAVRLAGLYALERLANSTAEHRQTIVNVICAYLRMPYTPLSPTPAAHADWMPALDSHRLGLHQPRSELAARQLDQQLLQQERQVRLTAQDILTRNLRVQVPASRPRWRLRPPLPPLPAWPAIHIDLTGATLLPLDMRRCQAATASFEGAQFTGDAAFTDAQLTDAAFADAQFTGDASFEGAQFIGDASFEGAQFTGDAAFRRAQFTGDAAFRRAQFTAVAFFGLAEFIGDANFGRAQFTGDAFFGLAEFIGDANFGLAQFTGDAFFRRAQFTDSANFTDAQFAGANFESAKFTASANFESAQFAGANFRGAKFTDAANFRGAKFTDAANFESAQLTDAANFEGAQFTSDADAVGDGPRQSSRWPPGWKLVDRLGVDGRSARWDLVRENAAS